MQYIRACCRRASTASRAQQDTISPAQSRRASTSRLEPGNASKQTELVKASMSLSIHIARFVLKTNQEIEICQAKYETTHKAAKAGVTREGLAYIPFSIRYNTLFLSVLLMYFVHACSFRVVFLEHGSLGVLQVVNLHLKSWASLSASFAFCSTVYGVPLLRNLLIASKATTQTNPNQSNSTHPAERIF